MASPRFVHNLKPDAVEAWRRGMSHPEAFLIAPGNAGGGMGVLTDAVVDAGSGLFVDNGNFDKLGPLTRDFAVEARVLKGEVDSVEDGLGRSVRQGELPVDLEARYRDLASRVRASALAAVPPGEDMAVLGAQFALRPTAVIGAEDLTMAAWLRLDIEPRYIHFRRRKYRAFNRAVARRATRSLEQLPQGTAEMYYPVASALSFNTAEDAGREFAAAGLPCASMGFGAFMADNHYSDHLRRGRRRLNFGANFAQRYTRTVAVAAGFWQGYQEEAGHAPKRFHFLGLGAPIMMSLVTLIGAATPELTFDATSPIVDATQGGTIYTEEPAQLKLRTRRVVHRLARTPDSKWSCPCPFCEDFVTSNPFDYKRGNRWFADTGATEVAAADLREGGALFSAYPLFSEPRSGDLRRAVNFARVGHNHWIVDRIMTSLHRAAQDGRLATRVENIVADYQRFTSPHFAQAMGFSLGFATGRI